MTAHPQHEYTQTLFLAAPVPDPVAQAERRAERLRLKAALSGIAAGATEGKAS